jgi:hypothetical protein
MAKVTVERILYRCDGPDCKERETFGSELEAKERGWIEGAEGRVYHDRECYEHGDPDEEHDHVIAEMIAAINSYRDSRFIRHATDRMGSYFDVIAEGTEREYKVTVEPRD